MSEEGDDEERAKIKQLFREADANGDGVIDRDELARVLGQIGYDDSELMEAFEEADTNGDGLVRYEEFIDWVFDEDDDDVWEAVEACMEWEASQLEFLSEKMGASRWKSVREIEPDSTLFGKRGLKPRSIEQGESGNCWFLSSLVSIAAQNPKYIRSLITAKGCQYKVKLYSYEWGDWKYVIVNDTIPVDEDDEPVMLSIVNKEFWHCIFQKALAKHCGGYPNIEGAEQVFALGMLMGTNGADLIFMEPKDHDDPASSSWRISECLPWECDNPHAVELDATNDETEQNVSYDEAFDFIVECAAAGYPMGANTEGHAYSLLCAKKDIAGSGFNLICLRNPYGEGERTGAWSDGDEKWEEYPEVAEACGYRDKDDGLFWLTLEDLGREFPYVEICKKAP